MAMVIGGTVFYIKADNEQNEAQEELETTKGEIKKNLEEDDEEPLVNKEKEFVYAPTTQKMATPADLMSNSSSAHFSEYDSGE